jgi:2,4-dienoyl-CoA reductase-like NADH-dependent reductase (Old Yellow Enzyme family)
MAGITFITLKNRFVRAGTSETMASERGEVTEELKTLYRDLARGGVGLIITGHLYVHPSGKYISRQTGIYDDSLISGLSELVQNVHQAGGRIFAQLAHAGSQCRVPGVTPLAPSVIPNALTERPPSEMTTADIEEAIEAWGMGARRAVEAGFDGIHIHSANGYLCSEFNSSFANRREDEWGGDPERRSRFLFSVYQRIRETVGPDFPVTLKLGVTDIPKGGLSTAESVDRVAALEEMGLDGLEVSCGVMVDVADSCGAYAGVGPKRAIQDWLVHRLTSPPGPEAYFLPHAQAMKKRLKIPVMLVGGMRTTETMEKVLSAGEADFINMARPFIREPDIVNQIQSGRRGLVDCTSCNICIDHEGLDPLQCWRKSAWKLMYHAYCRFWRDLGKKV